MYMSAQDVRSRALAAEVAGCTDGRLCYAAPFGAEDLADDAKPPAGPATAEIPTRPAEQAEFPIGPVAFVFGALVVVSVLSFFVKQSPAGRWYFDWRQRR